MEAKFVTNTNKKPDPQKVLIRSLVDNVYDIQLSRIAMGNRLIAMLKNLGIVESGDSSQKPEVNDEIDVAEEERKNNRLLKNVVNEYNLLSEEYATKFESKGSIRKVLNSTGVSRVYIHTELIYNLVSTFVQMLQTEKRANDILATEVKKHPMWDAFFSDVRGCGPLMAGVCIAYLDPYCARHRSSFWRYCGLDVVVDENGAHGRGRRDAYNITYEDKRTGEIKTTRTLGYNTWLKTKLVGVLGISFIRTGPTGVYARTYYDYRNRLENRPDCANLRPVVIHKRAIRYAVKMFLADLWKVWRELEGLPISVPYAEAKLGMAPHGTDTVVDDEELFALACDGPSQSA